MMTERRAPGTYRTPKGGIEVIVDIPESASWVEDQFPDEVAFIRAEAARLALEGVAERVEAMLKVHLDSAGRRWVRKSAVLALLSSTPASEDGS